MEPKSLALFFLLSAFPAQSGVSVFLMIAFALISNSSVIFNSQSSLRVFITIQKGFCKSSATYPHPIFVQFKLWSTWTTNQDIRSKNQSHDLGEQPFIAQALLPRLLKDRNRAAQEARRVRHHNGEDRGISNRDWHLTVSGCSWLIEVHWRRSLKLFSDWTQRGF